MAGLTAGTYFVSVFSTNTATYGDPRHITLTLAANDDAPVALADVADLNENTFANVAVLGNDTDTDAGDLHDVRSYTQPTHGTVFCAGDAATAQTWSCHYVPTHNYVGDDSFTYLVTDHRFGTATGTVTLHVHQVNTAPQAADDSVPATLGHATPINLTVDTFDAEGNTLTYAVVTPPAHTSSFSCTTAGACTYTGNALGSDAVHVARDRQRHQPEQPGVADSHDVDHGRGEPTAARAGPQRVRQRRRRSPGERRDRRQRPRRRPAHVHGLLPSPRRAR